MTNSMGFTALTGAERWGTLVDGKLKVTIPSAAAFRNTLSSQVTPSYQSCPKSAAGNAQTVDIGAPSRTFDA